MKGCMLKLELKNKSIVLLEIIIMFVSFVVVIIT